MAAGGLNLGTPVGTHELMGTYVACPRRPGLNATSAVASAEVKGPAAGPHGPIRAAVDVLVEPVTSARSRLTISVDFTGHGIGKILVPLVVRREARKEMPGNIAPLRQNLEAGNRVRAQ